MSRKNETQEWDDRLGGRSEQDSAARLLEKKNNEIEVKVFILSGSIHIFNS